MKKIDLDPGEAGTIRSCKSRFFVTHNGRTYAIFQPKHSAYFYIQFRHGGIQIQKSLECADLDTAVERSKRVIDAAVLHSQQIAHQQEMKEWQSKLSQPIVKRGFGFIDPNVPLPEPPVFSTRWEAKESLRRPAGQTTLAKIIKVYLKVSAIKKRSAKNNTLALLKIFERVIGRQDPYQITLDLMTKDLAQKYQESTLAIYLAGAAADDKSQREARDRALRSSRSTLIQARSLFSAKNIDMIDRYEAEGLRIPECVKAFLTCKLRGSRQRSSYPIATEDTWERISREVQKLKPEFLECFLGFFLCAGAGLRRSEAQSMRWEWLQEMDGHCWVCGGVGKDGETILVPIQSRAWEAIKPYRQPDGPIFKTKCWPVKLSYWLRLQGMRETTKTLHELRSRLASLLWHQSPYVAVRVMRHKDLKTTQSAYIRYHPPITPIDVM